MILIIHRHWVVNGTSPETTLETSEEDEKTTLETSEEDVETTEYLFIILSRLQTVSRLRPGALPVPF